MKKLYRQQNLGAIIILCIAWGLVWSIVPAQPFLPRGIIYTYAESQAAPITSTDVALYQSPPRNTSIIGRVSVELSTLAQTDAPEETMVDYAKALAASVGAKGLVLTVFGTQGKVYLLEAMVVD